MYGCCNHESSAFNQEMRNYRSDAGLFDDAFQKAIMAP